MVVRAVLALLIVLAAGRWLLRPLFHEFARHRSTEIFTLTVMFVVLAGAWATHALGLSMAIGAFLAGMLLAETEFRYQTEAVIKPFQDILLGLFFVFVGMMLDLRLLVTQLPLVLLLLAALLVVKAAIVAAIVRAFIHNTRKALRTGITVCMGGELGFALLTVLLNGRLVPTELVQPLLTAVVLSMLVGPLLVRYNGRIADRLLGRESTLPSDGVFETAATREIAKREHVIICGFGRVGQNLARVLEKRGFEFIALDLDPFRVRDARQAGDPVVYGDATQVDVLRALGLDQRERRRDLGRRARNPRWGSCARCASCARMSPCWCAPRTTAVSSSCRRPARPRSCRRSSRLRSRSFRTCCSSWTCHRRRSPRRPRTSATIATHCCAASSAGAMPCEPDRRARTAAPASAHRDPAAGRVWRGPHAQGPRPRRRRTSRSTRCAGMASSAATPTRRRYCARATSSCCSAPPRTWSTRSRACLWADRGTVNRRTVN